MAISDTQKVDYLFKKIGFGTTKTDTNANKLAANESIASPLLLRGDKVWQQAGDIPAVKPSTSSSIVGVYTGATTVECTEDITATGNRTWKTNSTDWIPPEFGSTYLVNVYIHTSGDAANAEDISNKVFVTGSGNNDEWFFDYQSGVLNFIGDNLPNGVNFSGKSVYIAGARYIGTFGVGAAAGEDANLGNLTISDTTISSSNNDSIILDPNGTGQVEIVGTNAVTIPSGTTAQRPAGTTGDLRFNIDTEVLEVYNGTVWENASGDTEVITTIDSFTGDGSTTAFTLSNSTTTNGTIVTNNGVMQEPGTSYSVSGTTLTMTEAPDSATTVLVRYTASSYDLGRTVGDSDSSILVDDSSATITSTINNSTVIETTATQTEFTGNVMPAADATYNLGSSSIRWDNLYTTDLHLSNMGKDRGNDVDGTQGDWTIQEGDENLYLISNTTGKRYKIMLQEIV